MRHLRKTGKAKAERIMNEIVRKVSGMKPIKEVTNTMYQTL
jgi:hypothetical protein